MDTSKMGFSFVDGAVNETSDADNGIKIAIHGVARIPRVTDVRAFIEHFGDERATAMLNGTSITVTAQRINRSMLKLRATSDAIESAVYNAMMGVRTHIAGTPRVVRYLPNGTAYNGTDIVEFRQLTVAALVDLGVDSSTAIERANNITF